MRWPNTSNGAFYHSSHYGLDTDVPRGGSARGAEPPSQDRWRIVRACMNFDENLILPASHDDSKIVRIYTYFDDCLMNDTVLETDLRHGGSARGAEPEHE